MKKLFLFTIITVFSFNVNAQWVQQNSGTINDLASVCFPSVNVGYVNNFGSVLKTTNGGSNWNVIPGVSIYNTYPLYFTSVDTGYTSGVGGILKTTDGGSTWVDNFPYTYTNAAEVIYFTSPNVGYAICESITLDSVLTFKTINAGGSWSLISATSSFGAPTSVQFTSQNVGVLVLNYDGIYKTIDGGITWLPKSTTFAASGATDIYFPSTNIGYAVGADTILKTINGFSELENTLLLSEVVLTYMAVNRFIILCFNIYINIYKFILFF